MKYDEQRLEEVLRRAPVPTAPPELKANLLAGFGRDVGAERSRLDARERRGGFWRRWWPVALPGLASAALAAVMAVQQGELNELRRSVAEGNPGAGAAMGSVATGENGATSVAVALQAEIERLRGLVADLTTGVAELEAVQAENQRLVADIADRKARMPAEFRDLQEAGERANRIQCVNNMKHLGLAVRIWANDHKDEFPGEIAPILPLLGSPKAMVCPADTGHTAAENLESFTSANLSYEFLAAGPGSHETEPHRVMWRCPFHRNVTLCDGSVQMLTPEMQQGLVTRDGKLYLEQVAPKP